MRSYGEVIDVRTAVLGPGGHEDGGHGGPGYDAAPHQFLWRGRIYLVREVLAHWIELGTWWSVRGAQVPTSVRAVAPEAGSAPAPARSVAADVGAVEREVWRVEAAAGRSDHPGVFDLVHDLPVPARPVPDPSAPALSAPALSAPDPSAPDPSARALSALPSRWRLARTLD